MQNEPIRILIVDGKLICGGVEAFLMNIYRHIDRDKVQFDFLVHYKEKFFYDDEVEKLGGKIYRLTFRNDRNIIKYIHDLNCFFKEHKEYNTVWGNMDGLAKIYLKIAKKNGVKTTICHSHVTNPGNSLKGLIKRLLKKGVYKYADYRFACSTEAGKYLFEANDFQLVPNAIELNKFSFNEEIREKIRQKHNWNDCFVIGHIGRFFTEKNHEYIVNIFEKILYKEPNARLCLCGDGDNKTKIENILKHKGINDKVIFTGNISNVNEYYQAFDVFILPSLYEGLPVTGIEAQTSGLKCFFSNNITREVGLIEENVNFLPIGNQNIDIWVKKIIDSKKYKRVDETSKIRKNGYFIDDLSRELEALFLKLEK